MTNRVPNRNESLVYLGISNWEYQCCGRTPEIGQSVDWQVSGYPAQNGYLLATAAAVDWVEDCEIIRFPYGCASWDPALGDPAKALVILWATWHESQRWPRLAGVVEEVYDVSAITYRDESGRVNYRSSSFDYRPVELATRWPDESFASEPGNRVTSGCVVGLRVASVIEPTGIDVRAMHDQRDRARRTFYVYGPPEVFGAAIPVRGDRLTVDLADPRLRSIDQRGYSAVVTGTVGQVSNPVHFPQGYTMFQDVDRTGPAPGELFVEIIADAT